MKKIKIQIKQNNQSLKNIKSGEFYSINSVRARGHKGEIGKVRKNGKIDTVIITHAPYTRGIKNIELIENPEKNKTETSYVLTKKETVTRKNIGKKHKNHKVTNPIDKSIIRKIKSKK